MSKSTMSTSTTILSARFRGFVPCVVERRLRSKEWTECRVCPAEMDKMACPFPVHLDFLVRPFELKQISFLGNCGHLRNRCGTVTFLIWNFTIRPRKCQSRRSGKASRGIPAPSLSACDFYEWTRSHLWRGLFGRRSGRRRCPEWTRSQDVLCPSLRRSPLSIGLEMVSTALTMRSRKLWTPNSPVPK